MDMQYPQFIAIDATSLSEDAYPVAIAWSLADGQIKTTLIEPEENWQTWDMGLAEAHGISPDTLYQRGETAWSVVRELDADLAQPTMYYNPHTDPYISELLMLLYASCERELDIALVPVSALSAQSASLIDEPLSNCDERVFQQLRLVAENQ